MAFEWYAPCHRHSPSLFIIQHILIISVFSIPFENISSHLWIGLVSTQTQGTFLVLYRYIYIYIYIPFGLIPGLVRPCLFEPEKLQNNTTLLFSWTRDGCILYLLICSYFTLKSIIYTYEQLLSHKWNGMCHLVLSFNDKI